MFYSIMSFKITNGEILDFIYSKGNFQDRSVTFASKFRSLAQLFITEHNLLCSVNSLQLTFKQIYDVKDKNDIWLKTVREFETECDTKLKRKSPGRLLVSLKNDPGEN